MMPGDQIAAIRSDIYNLNRHHLARLNRLEARLDRLEARVNSVNSSAATLRAIADASAAAFGIKPADLLGQSRLGPLIGARFAAYWLARHATDKSLPQIGRYLGQRDHSTIAHGIHRATAMRAADAAYRATTDALLASVGKVNRVNAHA